MIDLFSIARPYAQAAFEYAWQQQQMAVWNSELENLAKMVITPTIRQILQNPKYTSQQTLEIILALLEEKHHNVSLTNFLKILAEYKRLIVLPEIAYLFKELVAEQEKILQAQVFSAVKLDEPFLLQLEKTLNKKLNKAVKLRTYTDPHLLGGITVRIGDFVIDGSVRGELTRLKQELVRT